MGINNYKKLESEWYQKIAETPDENGEKFVDIEDTKISWRPLKAWTGISNHFILEDQTLNVFDLQLYQKELEPIKSSFPEFTFSKEETLFNREDFYQICNTVCSHGNHRLTPRNVHDIWKEYISGGTNRSIASILGINDSSVFRTIRVLTKWAEFMENEVMEDQATVIMRKYRPEIDDAFMFASWRNALWYDKKRPENLAQKFFRIATKHIKQIIKDPSNKINVACLSDDPNFLVGYAVIVDNVIEFVYVKIDYRNKGVATMLCKGFDVVGDNLTIIGQAIVKKKKLKIKENYGTATKEETKQP